MRRLLTYMLTMLVLLTAVPQTAYAQQKKPQSTSKTSTAKKPTAKPAPKSASKPAAKPAAKPKQTKPAAKPAAKPATPAKPSTPKKLSRAEYEKQQRDLQKQIAATEQMISDNDKSVLSQSRDIKLREDEIAKRRALLVSMTLEIESIKAEEDSLGQEIARLKSEYKGKQDKYAAAVQHIYKWRSGYDEWLFILSANDMMEGLRRMRYLRQYGSWREQEAHQLAHQRQVTESVQEKLALTRIEREQLLTGLQKERDILANKQKQQEQALANLKKRQKELKSALAADKKKQAEIQRQITKLIEEERRASQGKSSGGKTGTSASHSSPEDIQLTGSFKQNKGKMPFPVDSNFSILSHYTRDGNYSITISTAVGAHACAVFEGTVKKVVRTSEDWTILINHGEYTSVYSGLSLCHVKEGDKVKMRQSIGVIKTDVDGKRAEMMFWIYGKNDAENPELWLKK
ncbi:MAG: peptidoglycan DD-metalloendopeptidase family protein [Bacteroidales bacterium]|nr:peptidoglycan DD-metalloendopeptidase family protein [Candidatus Liminaster caballi]